jgi:hypothetical protein
MLSHTLRSSLRSAATPAKARSALPVLARRAFASTPVVKSNEEITRPAIDTPLSLWNFTEEENMLRETGECEIVIESWLEYTVADSLRETSTTEWIEVKER